MNRKDMSILVCISILAMGTILPAYAEVSSLKTNSVFYKGGSKIYFSGTIGADDPSGVTLTIFNPNGQFILLSSAIADSSHNFQIIVDTSVSDNQQKFSVKGMYNATAFVLNKENGKTVSFVFSPDGSPITPSSPVDLTASVSSSNVINLKWVAPTNNGGAQITGYKIERNDGSGFVAIQTIQETTYQDTGLSSAKSYSYRVSAINAAGTSEPSNVVSATTFSVQPPTAQSTGLSSSGSSSSSSTPSLEYLIQQRIEQAKKLQGQLHSQTGQQQSVQLNEKIAMGDSIIQNNLQSSPSQNNDNNTPSSQFYFGSMLYPVIAVIGAGIIGVVLYLRKTGVFQQSKSIKQKHTMPEIVEQEDYAMMILKNRLAKGELTLDQFQVIKDVLLEP